MRNRQALERVIGAHAKAPYRELFISQIKPSIRLRPIASVAPLPIGATKLGGRPDLPSDVAWPKVDEDRHYGFIDQVNLRQIKPFDLDDELPADGMLYFFHDMEHWENGKVIYRPEAARLGRTPAPTDISRERKTLWQRITEKSGKSKLLNECALHIHPDYRFFPKRSVELAYLLKRHGIPQAESYRMINEEIYHDYLLYDGEEEISSPDHHLLGYHESINFHHYQFSLLNLPHDIRQLSLTEIEAALNWKLLFQFDSDCDLNTDWSDWGRVYYFINADDLRNGNFTNVKVVGDSHIR